MNLRGRETTAPRATPRTRVRTVLHRGGATVEVLYVGADCVTVRVTRAPRASGRAVGSPSVDRVGLADDAGPEHPDPHVRAVLDASAAPEGTLLEALDGRVGDDVAGIVLDQRGPGVVVTLDLLPTRRARPHAATPPRPWGPAPVR